MVVGEGEAVERLGDGLLDDLLEAVAVHPEVVCEALQLVRPELLQGVPLALGELKINFEVNSDANTTRVLICKLVKVHICTYYWAPQKNLVKGCRETLDCCCVSCESLSASKAYPENCFRKHL